MTANGRLLHPDVSGAIIGAFFDVYNEMGFGLLESVYAAALEEELLRRGRVVEREQWVAVYFKGEQIARQRVDMIVDRRVVVEIKAAEVLPRFAERQLLNYLIVSDLELGLLLHFGPEPKFYRRVSITRPRRSRRV
jgi:GxxExxY protein